MSREFAHYPLSYFCGSSVKNRNQFASNIGPKNENGAPKSGAKSGPFIWDGYRRVFREIGPYFNEKRQ